MSKNLLCPHKKVFFITTAKNRIIMTFMKLKITQTSWMNKHSFSNGALIRK